MPVAARKPFTNPFRLVLASAALLALTSLANGERLPVKHYTVDEGLPHNRVMRIVRDSQGFLWFCTPEGLSRFDGQRFSTFRPEGDFMSTFNDFLETRNGQYWAATNGSGVFSFNYSPRSPLPQVKAASLFTAYPVGDTVVTNSVNVLCEDGSGRIWAGTDGGLFALDVQKGEQSFVPVSLGIASHADRLIQVWAIIEGDEGSLWIGTKYGLTRRLADGRIIHYAIQPRSYGTDVVRDLFRDEDGRLWIAHEAGVLIVKTIPVPEAAESHPLWQTLAQRRPLLSSEGFEMEIPSASGQALWLEFANAWCVRQASDKKIYIANRGEYLIEFDGRRLRTYSTMQGLDREIRTIAEDVDGNLWLGTQSAGATRLARSGLTKYGEADGLKSNWIVKILEDRAGNLYVWDDGWRLHRFDGHRFISVRLNLPDNVRNAVGQGRDVITDREGQWWVSTPVGLFRFPRVGRIEDLATVRPVAVYTTREGLAGNDVRKLFEDWRGDVWIAAFAPDREVVTRWERATGTFHRYSDTDGLPPLKRVQTFGEDASGSLWMGFWGGGLARYKSGRFALFMAKDGLPDRTVDGIHLDSAGRLWVSTNVAGGLYRVDDAQAERPVFVRHALDLSRVQGPIIEDTRGRLYFNSGRGLARLDPEEGKLSYTDSDGLVSAGILSGHRDQQGNLWLGTSDGLSRLIPAPDRESVPPPVFISAIRVGTVSQSISAFGEREISGLEVGPDQNQIQIDFSGLSFAQGGPLRYQHKIDGLDAGWSEPTDQNTFYATLRPGDYRFLVRGVTADGAVSPAPATVDFRILPPVWRRWWFITIAAMLVAGGVVAFDRYRVARLKELDAALTESRVLTHQLTEQEAELRRANRSLVLEAAVTAIISESATLTEAAPKILRAICESAGWEIGELWQVDGHDTTGTPVLRCVDVWHAGMNDAAEFEAHSRITTRLSGMGLPGRVLAGAEPVLIADLAMNAVSPRMHLAVEAGLRSAFGFPILLGHEVLGVLELFSRTVRHRDTELLEMMSTIGSHIGQLIDRKRSEEALRRSREERLAELEQVRRRIATDLHDDIGSTLTQISILSEVMRQRTGREDSPNGPLSMIARSSRELVDAMSDIVWAINPQKDHLSDLSQRMRRFASDVFTARNIEFQLRTPDRDRDVKLGANLRREVFLIFKESINNMLRHSACTAADIEFQLTDDLLSLRLSDDGKGFDVTRENDGHGLMSMRERAKDIGGHLEVVSNDGGTTVVLKASVGHLFPPRNAKPAT